MEVILSTRNPSKVDQIRASFDGSRIKILTLTDAGIVGEAIEDGETLEENALKKAIFAKEHAGPEVWTMADDSGIFIDALGGVPGVKSARWAGEEATTDDITRYTLERLRGATDRSATFETVVAVISPEGERRFFTGMIRGHLLEAPRVPPQPKMPYSPLFVPEGTNLVWAEMSVVQENAISHRGKAFRLAKTFLESVSR